MLKAYDYAEPSTRKKEMKDVPIFRLEKQIAQRFVMEHSVQPERQDCPICGSRHTKYIFERWDINYRICDECKSIYVPVANETVQEYLELKEMQKLRASDEFQQQVEESKKQHWMDFVMWAEYRIFRYLGKKTGLKVIDYGNRYSGFSRLLQQSQLVGVYELRNPLLELRSEHIKQADVILHLNQLQHENDPIRTITGMRDYLRDGGVLILNTRLGSGFDILTLKGATEEIFPYEHITLPSRHGLELILESAGFELLEITTPGTRDMDVVMRHKERIEEANFFIKYLLDTVDASAMSDFQQFLQKSGLSSFAQVVARKRS